MKSNFRGVFECRSAQYWIGECVKRQSRAFELTLNRFPPNECSGRVLGGPTNDDGSDHGRFVPGFS